jgi:RNA recognition motif-containing protein
VSLTIALEESLRDYFSQFGEVTECTVMRDGASGRSRGFGFLTFKDPKTVNVVMVKEHYLDGKIVSIALYPVSGCIPHFRGVSSSDRTVNLKKD